MSIRRKIALIGAGNIGGIIAMLMGIRPPGEVVLYDVIEGMPQGKALDLMHFASILSTDYHVTGTNRIEDIAGAKVCIVTSGVARKPGMSRKDLVKVNAAIIKDIAKSIREHAPDAFVIVVTNPLDAMAWLMQRETGFPHNRVVGMAGVLDAGRYRAYLAQELGVSTSSVSAMVFGGHGDAMVPVRAFTTLKGIPIERLLTRQKLDAIEDRVRNSGAEIVNLLKSGSAFYSPAASALRMAETYLGDRKVVMACSAYCDGQYNVPGIYFGVPVVIGAGGVERIFEFELGPSETELLRRSVQEVQETIALIDT